MKKVDTRPTEGQFIEIWEHNGVPWSSVIRIDESGEYEYNSVSDTWEVPNIPPPGMRFEWYII